MIKFRKTRNEEEWTGRNSSNRKVRIFRNLFSRKTYTVNCGTFFEFCDTLEEAKEIANKKFR